MNNETSCLVTRYKLKVTHQKLIENLCHEMPYYFFKDCAYGNVDHPMRKEMNPYFSHTLLHVKGTTSDFFYKFPWDEIGKAINLPDKKMFRAHMTLQYPRPDAVGVPHNAHVDDDRPHLVALYYPNHSDGDTYFFNQSGEVIHTEEPERGKIIVFDGRTLHSSSSPSTNVRFSLNINYGNL